MNSVRRKIDYKEKILEHLRKNHYSKAKELSLYCKISTGMVYYSIKKIKQSGIGIYGNRKGFVLSEYANQRDDVEFIRKCMGRRTSDTMAIEAVKKDILNRWKGIQYGKSNLLPVLGALSLKNKDEETRAVEGLNYLLSYVNDKGL